MLLPIGKIRVKKRKAYSKNCRFESYKQYYGYLYTLNLHDRAVMLLKYRTQIILRKWQASTDINLRQLIIRVSDPTAVLKVEG